MAELRSVVLPGFGGLVAIAPRTGAGAQAFSPASLSDYLYETAEALEAVRLDQAIATAAAEAELRRARGMIDLLRGALRRAGAAAQAPASPWRARLRPAIDLARQAAGRGRRDAPGADLALERLRASPVMDRNWYLEHYPDVAAARLDPAEHYLRHGAAELRDPGPHFSSSAYLAAHPQAEAAGANPLEHFVAAAARG